MYLLKQKDLCDYDPGYIMSSALMFDDTIMNIISNKKLAHTIEKNDCLFTYIEKHHLYVHGVTSRILLGTSNLRVSRSSICKFPFKKNRHETILNPHIKKRHFNW